MFEPYFITGHQNISVKENRGGGIRPGIPNLLPLYDAAKELTAPRDWAAVVNDDAC